MDTGISIYATTRQVLVFSLTNNNLFTCVHNTGGVTNTITKTIATDFSAITMSNLYLCGGRGRDIFGADIHELRIAGSGLSATDLQTWCAELSAKWDTNVVPTYAV